MQIYLKTVQPRASQPNVEENEIGPARNDSGQRFVAVARIRDPATEALRPQCPGDVAYVLCLLSDSEGCFRDGKYL